MTLPVDPAVLAAKVRSEAREMTDAELDAYERLGGQVEGFTTTVTISFSWLDRLRILFGRKVWVTARVRHMESVTILQTSSTVAVETFVRGGRVGAVQAPIDWEHSEQVLSEDLAP